MKSELAKLRKQYKVPPAPKLRKGETLFPPWPEFGTFEVGLGNKEWISLFDGKTLNGWHKSDNDSIKVVNGEIHLSPDPQVFYMHTREFTDFILELEAKMPKENFDSGVGFRCVLPKGKDLPQGYQSEISDIRSGGIFDIGVGWLNPPEKKDKIDAFVKRTGTFLQSGKWNQIRVRAKGDQIQTWINGQLSSDIKDNTHKSGTIGLQHHSEEGVYRFRNLRIREI